MLDLKNEGDVAERFNAPVSKTDIPKGIGGSNPPISAKILIYLLIYVIICYY